MLRTRVEVLGSVALAVNDLAVPLSPRQLAVVARLALNGARPTPRSRLLAAWPDGTGSDGALRVALTRLRQLIAPARLVRVDGGYVLDPAPSLDSAHFEQLVRSAHDASATPAERLARLDDALGLWRGPAFESLTDLEWAAHEAARLHELHERARDLRHLSLLGQPGVALAAVLAGLTADLSRTPGREHRAELLARALCRAGRPGDALDVLADLRRHVRTASGRSPGRAVDELELRILNDDPRLSSDDLFPAEPHPSVDGQLSVARELLHVGDPLAAEPFADAALGAARSHGHRSQLAGALLLGAEVATLTGSRPSRPLVEEAHALARLTGDGGLIAAVALLRHRHGSPSDWRAALTDLTEPLASLEAHSDARLDVLVAGASLLALSGEPVATDELTHAAHDTHRAIGSERSEAMWLAVRTITADAADLSDRLGDASRAVALARRGGDSRLVVVALLALLRVAWANAELDTIDGVLDELDHHSRQADIATGRLRAQVAAGALALARGDLDRAEGAVRATREIGTELDEHSATAAAYWQELQIAIERGSGAALLPVLRGLRAGGAVGASASALAAQYGTRHDLDRLRLTTRATPATALATVQVARVARVAAQHSDTELGEWALGALERLGSQVVMQGFGTLVLGPARLFVGQAYASCGKWTDAALAFADAESVAEAAGAPLWSAEARVWLARAHAELGDGEIATRLLMSTPIGGDWVRIRDLATRAEATRVTSGVRPRM